MKLTGFLLVSFFAFMSCQSKTTSVSNTIAVSADYSSLSINIDQSTTEEQYAERFQAFILNGDSLKPNQSPIIGIYALKGNRLSFTPSYPFLKGKTYLVRYADNESVVRKKFTVHSEEQESITVVSRVYPSADTLPLNILKLYIAFNHAMSEGFAYDNIFIVNTQNDTLQDVFLELEEELWSSDMQRLTLLFDPGRIKQGLESFDELGYAFKEGETYQLMINSQWPDANGNPLESDYRKSFTIGSPVTSKAGNFSIIDIPENGSKTPLILNFDKPHDHALMQRTIDILNTNGVVVEGTIGISAFETVWQFSPNEPWATGSYSVRIENILEDTSGNNLLNAFDVDNREGKTDFSNQKYSTSEFRIK